MRRIIAFLVFTLFLAGSSNAELVIEQSNTPSTGDYLKFEVIGDTFATNMGKSMFGDDYVGIESFESEIVFEIVGFEILEIDGQKYDCYIESRSMIFNFTVIIKEDAYDPQPDGDRINYSFSFVGKFWKNGTGLITDKLKTESIDSYIQTWTEDGEQKSYEGVTEENILHTKTQGVWPDTLEVGASWTISEDLAITSTSRSRANEGEWDVETSETEESETIDYEVTAESKVTTSLGTFNTLVIKQATQGEGSGNYTIEYLSSDFFTVKGVIFDNDEPILTMQIKEYSISSLESQSLEDGDSIAEGLPNLSFLLSVSSIALIASRKRLQ